MRTSLRLLGTLFALSFAAALPAQELLAVNFAGQAFGVDPNTGQARVIGATGVPSLNAMASHDGVLYGAGPVQAPTPLNPAPPNQLVVVDPITAQATVLFPNLGIDIRALCSNEGTNELFAITNGSPDRLHRIDVTTGAVTLVGNTGFTGIQALDAAGGLGPLLGWDVNVGLVRIDRTTGAGTDVDTSLGTQGAAIQFLAAVQENSTLRLLGGNSSLYEVDRFTGVVTQIGAGGNLADLRGAEHRRGRATVVGTGCQAAGTALASLGAKAQFLAGETLNLFSPQHASSSLGILVVGLTTIAPPVDLGPIFGTAGCNLYVTPDLLLGAAADSFGRFNVPFVFPAAFGLAVHFQLAALEPVPGGWSFTNGFSVQVPF